MFRRKTKVEALAERVRRITKASGGADIRILGGNQLLIRKNMIDNPAVRSLAKAPAHIPGNDGYECYVATYLFERRNAVPSQRMLPPEPKAPIVWQPGSMKLIMHPNVKEAEWEVLVRGHEVVTVRVRRGQNALLQEINRILSAIEYNQLR